MKDWLLLGRKTVFRVVGESWMFESEKDFYICYLQSSWPRLKLSIAGFFGLEWSMDDASCILIVIFLIGQ